MLTTAAGAHSYIDDFYACNGAPDTFVTSIDNAFRAVTAQAHP